jgi:transcription initiation factor TFIIIB Brf1 subunit/transcription initiation factor TFIIB
MSAGGWRRINGVAMAISEASGMAAKRKRQHHERKQKPASASAEHIARHGMASSKTMRGGSGVANGGNEMKKWRSWKAVKMASSANENNVSVCENE